MEGSKGLQLPSSHIFDRIDSYNSSQRLAKIFLQRVRGGPLFLANEVHLHYKSTAHADFVLLFVQTEQRDRFVIRPHSCDYSCNGGYWNSVCLARRLNACNPGFSRVRIAVLIGGRECVEILQL